MENQNALLWEVSIWEFVFVTVILGGGGAWMTGRAFARSWMEPWKLAASMVLLAAAVRFIHFALFGGSLLTAWYFVIDLIVLEAIAFVGMRYTRAGQMGTRYRFKYERSGPLSWNDKSPRG